MKTILPVLAAILCFLAPAAFAADAPTLNVGDPAPPLVASKWFKGEPVTKIEPGHVYVVEFWATWCGPCKTSIPHLTELAKQHAGKVTFVGMSVWERDKDNDARFAKIEEFVKSMGDKMGYSVAADLDSTMADTWMRAAGERGIPSAFLVGKDAKIAWIGHPMSDLGKVIPAVLDGTWDAKAAAEKRAETKGAAAKMQTLMAPVQELMRAGKLKEAIEAIDKVVAENPDMKSRLELTRFQALIRVDEAAAREQARGMLASAAPEDASKLASVARSINTARNGQPDHELALSLAQKANELSPTPNPMYQGLLADIYKAKGDIAKAVEHGERAVELAKKQPGGEKLAEYLAKRVESYKAPAPAKEQ